MEEFTDEERRLLAPFCSNLDKPVFVLRNLPEVVKGALFSRYSRSVKSLRRTLLDEFIKGGDIGITASGSDNVATEKAEAFYDRVLLGYGDDSVAELAGAHIALEDISIIATKVVEDARIGLSPLEKSTRYVYFDQKVSGKWRYYEEPDLMASEFSSLYTETCDSLFSTYASLIPRVSKYVTEKMPRDEKLSDRAFEATVRAKTCDNIRGLLPASTKTNMGFFGNGRSYEYLITKMYADPLAEMRALAKSVQTELRTTIPSFVKRPDTEHGVEMQRYLQSTRLEKMGAAIKDENCTEDEVILVDYDKDAEERVVAAALYPFTDRSMASLIHDAKHKSADEREKIVSAYVGERKNRRQKPGRAFETARYTFDICANFGCYRDLHRHRMLTQQRQNLGCLHGYTLPKDIVDAGFESEFKDAMAGAKNAWERIGEKYPIQAQYVVPLAYRIRWQMTMNLREMFHFCELRSARQGHVDYRRIAQGMFKEVERVHPGFTKHMIFMDMNEYEFERLDAEKSLDRKMAKMGQKP